MPKIPPQLCIKAIQGDQAALAKVITQMMPTIRRGALRAACPGLDLEDAEQEGLIGLFTALRTYDPQGAASFPPMRRSVFGMPSGRPGGRRCGKSTHPSTTAFP